MRTAHFKIDGYFKRIGGIVLGVVVGFGFMIGLQAADDFADERAAMLRDIRRHVDNAVAAGLSIAPIDQRVMDAMKAVPRHEFVPRLSRDLAYGDGALSIGHGQTISQPFIVALMTDLLEVGPEDVVLEVGTGSGYQAAVLAHLVKKVYTIEIIPELAVVATARLKRLGFDNVEVLTGDGYLGWPEAAPFDGIIVTAGAEEIPPPLLDQLAPGGRMVIPLSTGPRAEQLTLIRKTTTGRIREEKILPVRFVPLVRDR